MKEFRETILNIASIFIPALVMAIMIWSIIVGIMTAIVHFTR